MVQITTRLSDELLETLDSAASALKRSRADVVRLAVERYLESYEDLSLSIARLQDPSDPVLDWEDVKRALLAQD